MEQSDVIVIGGGIAGSSAAGALARQGLSVRVLERTAVHEDRVRGEGMPPWGVAEAEKLGVDELLLAADGCFATEVATYDEAWDAADVAPTDLTQLGLRGFLHVGHPEASQALIAAAAAAGAVVERDVEVTDVRPGPRAEVTYRDRHGNERQIAGRLVIGADGRSSFVRRHLGLTLHESTPLTFGGGLLVRNPDWPAHRLVVGTEGPFHYIVAPRTGAARLYLFAEPDVGRDLFRGADKTQRFLDVYRFTSLPDEDAFATADPAGPCAGFDMNDTWVDDPTAPGVVLIGDAAGWNNPIIGQGLAIAMRDARQVVDAVTSGTYDLGTYVAERRERLRRLRATAFVDTCVLSRFDDAGRAARVDWRDRVNVEGDVAAYVFAKAIGVDDFPPETYEPATIERLVGTDHPYLAALASHGLEIV